MYINSNDTSIRTNGQTQRRTGRPVSDPIRYERTRRTNCNAKRNADGDTFETRRLTREEKQEIMRQRKKVRAWMNRAAGFLAATGIILGGQSAYSNITAPHDNFNGAGNTVAEVAEFTDVDERAILLANGIDYTEDTVNEIVLPQKTDVFEEGISELEEKLQSEKLSSKEKAELKEELAALEEKQSAANELFTVYTDEDNVWAYIVPNEDLDRSPSLETVKEILGIEDGVIRKSNPDIDYNWATDDPEYGAYKDYSGARLPLDGIKVKLKEINAG